jgi:signal transduction histidine kinase
VKALVKPAASLTVPASRHLEHLYEIGRVLLSPSASVAIMVEAVLDLVVQVLPLRGVILIEKQESRPRLFAWRPVKDAPGRLDALKRSASSSFAAVTGLSIADAEEREYSLAGALGPGEEAEPVVIPLALPGQASFGILQLDPARPLDEAGLAFAATAAALVAIALDRFYMRSRETSLRQKAERAEMEALRAKEDLERLVAERTAQLDQTVKDLHAFAYSIAHDLRAPLRHIHGYSEFLIKGAGAESQPYARRIMAASLRMDHLIEDLLLYSRLTLDRIKAEPLEPSAVLARVILGMDARIRDKQARLDVESPLPRVMGSSLPLGQVFENLLSNALKFTERGVFPTIRVRSERRGDRVRLVVEDNGIGIAPAHQSRIFEVFQRLHKSADYPGTGIGLAIARRAAERMGGSVGVESAAGHGSRFWVELAKAG